MPASHYFLNGLASVLNLEFGFSQQIPNTSYSQVGSVVNFPEDGDPQLSGEDDPAIFCEPPVL